MTRHPLKSRPVFLTLPRFAMLLALLTGCASAPPPVYYTLAPTGSGARSDALADAPRAEPAVVAVGPVHLPEYLDRPYIVVRKGAYVVQPSPSDQWASPLDDMLPRVLIENLAMRLPADRIVAFPPAHSLAADRRVIVDISRFDLDQDGRAQLVATWQIARVGDPAAPLLGSASIARAATDAGYESSVAALSEVLGELGDRIADDLIAVLRSEPQALSRR